jgi:hypothetical protein
MNEYPTHYVYVKRNNCLSWIGIPGAEEYLIEYKESPLLPWKTAYSGGNATCCPFEFPDCSITLRGKHKKEGTWFNFGPEEELIVVSL